MAVGAAALLSCDVSTLLPQSAPPPPGAVNTIVVETAQAASTQTAAAMPPTETPTLTPIPSRTPSITPSLTPTFLFLLSTPTRTATFSASSGDYACQLTGQSPEDGTIMKKNQNFTASWTVVNSGQAAWNTNNVDFVYLSGVKMANIKAADLPKSVSPGQSITLTLSMTAPSVPDKYKTAWTLQQGKTAFCRLTVNIVVK